jgi:hypothetical protein
MPSSSADRWQVSDASTPDENSKSLLPLTRNTQCKLALGVPMGGKFLNINTLDELRAMPEWTAETPLRCVRLSVPASVSCLPLCLCLPLCFCACLPLHLCASLPVCLCACLCICACLCVCLCVRLSLRQGRGRGQGGGWLAQLLTHE